MKHFYCRSLGNDCPFEVHKEDIGDLITAVIVHLAETHGVKLYRDGDPVRRDPILEQAARAHGNAQR
jgi:predicted small metal-binding protein